MAEATPVIVPRESANDEFSVIVEWCVESGASVKEGDVIAVLENTKAAFELAAEQAGFIHYRYAPNDKVAVGKPVAYISADADFVIPDAVPPAPPAGAVAGGSRRASAKAARMMREHGLNLDDFPGVEVVREADVEARIKTLEPSASPAAAAAPDLPFRPLAQPPSKVFEIAQLRAAGAEAIPSTVCVPIPAAPVANRLAALAEEGCAVTTLELAIHACAGLLPDHPQFNAFCRDDRPFEYEHVNIGFAVNLGRGLKVPVIADANRKRLTDIAVEVKDLVLGYARNQLDAKALSGGTFTVTDLSLLDVSFFVPVLPRDQSAILGICATPAGGDSFNLILTFDHRVADGMEAARFLTDLRERLEG